MEPAFARALETLEPRVGAAVRAARRAVRRAAPDAEEVPYRSRRPRSRSAMWKLARYRLDGADVAGVGAFPAHAALWLYRGRELDDGSGVLAGSGRDLRFVRLASASDASSPALARLLAAAFRLARGGAGVAVRRRKPGAARRRARDAVEGRPATIDDYLGGIGAERRAMLDALRATIRAALPGATECISYRVPAFRLGGRVICGFAATATGGSFYPFSGRTLETLAPEIGRRSRTRSALHFAAEAPLPAALVRKLLRARLAELGRPRVTL